MTLHERKPWTEAEERLVMNQCRSGKPVQAIAARVKRSTTAVRAKICLLRKYGHDLPRLTSGGEAASRTGQPWTAEEMQQMWTWDEEGVPQTEIASRLGRSFDSVRVRLHRMQRDARAIPASRRRIILGADHQSVRNRAIVQGSEALLARLQRYHAKEIALAFAGQRARAAREAARMAGGGT